MRHAGPGSDDGGILRFLGRHRRVTTSEYQRHRGEIRFSPPGVVFELAQAEHLHDVEQVRTMVDFAETLRRVVTESAEQA